MKTRYMNGSTPLPDRLKASATHSLLLSDEDYDKYTSAKYFTDTEAKSKAEQAADELAENRESVRLSAKERRDTSLDSLAVEVNGNSIQVRPKDEVNLRLTLLAQTEGSVEWILSDNTVADVTIEDLTLAYGLGLELAQGIYQEYKDIIKGM